MKTRKKSKFLTFCFSMIPGAAQMYMGFMRMGVSLMLLFGLIIILAVWLSQGAVAAFCVVVWFYSFFQGNHLAGLSDEDFDQVEDTYLFGIGGLPGMESFVREHSRWIAALLIFLGACLLWDSMANLFYSVLPDEFRFISRTMRRIGDYVPSLVIGGGIIALGVKMIGGKKEDIWQGEVSDGEKKEEPWHGEAVFTDATKEHREN